MLFFIDESGTDHHQAPYEVLAGISVRAREAWQLILAIRDAQLRFFGVPLADVLPEFKGSKLLKTKTFRLARQLDPLEESSRRDHARALLEKGRRARDSGVQEQVTRLELTAYAQACLAYASFVLELCALHDVRVFASIVELDAPQPQGRMLRKDFSYLFERFYYSLEAGEAHEHGIVVFDELDKTQSRRLSAQMRAYFQDTAKGRRRATRILPEPFWVHSDLTTLVQVADLVAYCLNWGWRLRDKMTKPTRQELMPFGFAAAELQFRGRRFDGQRQRDMPVFGICHIRDLRPVGERTLLGESEFDEE
ncbi:DUF3800 domain-containing protein [Deinococcus peraridilitoris]|uniref:DUF3800 domain-containing protein n=1 Tax=Deinococcus peraridilitoris (strain DSM 19664 / LMG 22246 / CIP 109416 / KR-200) TaxID=937777 RepID=L0A2G9_DEIPD|nr:DUF3800 domain-containing protein [Deinococcus peraridilitoris]AFZ67200.1 hypothetical protein Deipe_1667 [Deinococcus peraridilitoris DSM 19664]